jgi:glycosyltransferase
MPTISIITASFNAAATIADCLRSVNAQSLPAEQIVIDGASGDATVAVVRQVSPAARIVSEPDQGIYDAMNKGITLARGEVIGFLNADDFYASPGVIARVAAVFADPAVICTYGDLEYVRGDGDTFTVLRYWRSGRFTPRSWHWGWMPPHPTFFARRSAFLAHGLFRLDLGSAADYELMLRFLLKHRLQTTYIPEVLVRMRPGGASNVSLTARLKANRMDRRAWEVNGLTPYPWTMFCKPVRKLGQYLFRQ